MFEERITQEDLTAWFARAHPGEQVVYAIGPNLFAEGEKSSVAQKVFEAYEAGKVILLFPEEAQATTIHP